MNVDLDALTREQLIRLVRRQEAELAILRNGEPPPGAMSPAAPATWRGLLAALFAVLAATLGEYLLRTGAWPMPGILLYAGAAVLLAATSARFVLHSPAPRGRVPARELWWIVGSGTAIALALGTLTFVVLRTNLRDPAGFWLWLATACALLATGAAAWPLESPSPRWLPLLPRTHRGRWLLWLAVLLILAAAVAARVMAIDRIPYGINPDEGDRAATAIQVVRGTTDRTIFESGWYRISMMYFTLLARWLEWWGIGFVQARLFTALFGVASVASVLWIGLRQWGTRVGLLAGSVMALMGLALQFSRETSEAGPTMALWALSVAMLLEGARTGRVLPWIGSGLAGGASLYFYPSGRLWPLLAALVGIYLLARWWSSGRVERLRVARGLALAAVASLAVAVPFFVHALAYPDEFALRLVETSVLRPENAARLDYVNPDWSTPRLLIEQVGRSLGVFSRYPDGAGFWPMHKPVLGAMLAVLSLLGLGFCALRWRDPRCAVLTLWFGVGISGMVLTVETPNVQRIATAVPVLALAAAVLLDEIAHRIESIFSRRSAEGGQPAPRMRAIVAATTAVAVVLAAASAAEARFYFRDYAAMNLWEGWNQEGRALTLLPGNTLHTTLSGSFHMINSGWVRLLAPEAARAGIRSPGAMLPLPEDGSRGLSFLLYPGQEVYGPWLSRLYPGLHTIDYALPGEGTYFKFLYVEPERVSQSRGFRVASGGTATALNARLSSPWPLEEQNGTPATYWSTLRVPQEGNYLLRVGPAPAELWLDGQRVLALAEGQEAATVLLHLARGDHALRLSATRRLQPVEWARVAPGDDPQVRPIEGRELTLPSGESPLGWSARVAIEGLPEQWRQDNALATCCLGGLLQTRGRSVHAEWSAHLTIATAGDYSFRLTLPGSGRLRIDGVPLAQIADPSGGSVEATRALSPGQYELRVEVESGSGADGPLEFAWKPPREPFSILPADMLTPAHPLHGPPLSDAVLLVPDAFPADNALEVVE